MRRMHPKSMPVILAPGDYRAWMKGGDATALAKLFPEQMMEIAERE